MGYALKLPNGGALPLTRFVDPQILLKGESNTITFEHDPAIKRQVFELFSTNRRAHKAQASKLSELLCRPAEGAERPRLPAIATSSAC